MKTTKSIISSVYPEVKFENWEPIELTVTNLQGLMVVYATEALKEIIEYCDTPEYLEKYIHHLIINLE